MSVLELGALERKSMLQASQLAYLADISRTFHTELEINRVLQKLLLVLPEELSQSKIAIFVFDHINNSIYLKSYVGFEPQQLTTLEKFYSHASVLNEVITQKKVFNLPSHELPFDVNQKIMKDANIKLGILAPLLSLTDCMGVLFLGGMITYCIDNDLDNFIQIVATQIGQAISLDSSYRKLKASEMLYRSLLENASCCIFVANLRGNIVETNKQGEKLLGRPKSEIIGTRFKDHFTPEFKAQVGQWSKDLEMQKFLHQTEIQIMRSDGATRIVDGSGVLVEVGDEQLILLIGTDVTEMNQLRGKNLLHDKLSMIGLLAAGVAHEINNPIACVLSNLEFLKEQVNEIKKAKNKNKESLITSIEEVLAESVDASIRVKEIVDDLRIYSRNDAVQEEEFDLHQVLDSAISMSASECKNRAKVVKHYAKDLPLVRLHRGRLHQVFLNVIVNAAQSIPPGSSDKEKIVIGTKGNKDGIIVSVQDTGKGIPQDQIQRIFDPFFTTKPIGEGTGLGLFICHEIITNMGGEIKVESKQDVGTTFLIQLPLSVRPGE